MGSGSLTTGSAGSQDVRVRHIDPHLSPYGDVIRRLEGAMTITTEVATVGRVMASGRVYEVDVPDDGSEVRAAAPGVSGYPESQPSDSWKTRR